MKNGVKVFEAIFRMPVRKITVVALVVVIGLFAGCGGECDHDWVEGGVTLPTCTENGFTALACSICSERIRSPIPALGGGHMWGFGGTVTAPTCTDDGFTTQTCLRCPETRQTNPTPVLPGAHVWGNDVVTEPTCTEGGFTAQTCDRCSETRQINPTPAAHLWNNEVTEPTCTAGGFTTQSCTRCPVTREINRTSALGHEWNNVVTPPTCLEVGFTTQTCTRCSETRQINWTSALGHNWNWATHTAGSGLRVCQNAGCTVTAGVGDTGQGGGRIFYANEEGFDFFQTATDTQGVRRHYLEATLVSNFLTFLWSTGMFSITDIQGTGTAIGTGMRNTALILAVDANAPAALACQNFSHNGKEDWFLPSRDELNALFQNRAVVGNLGTNIFWSSSQFSAFSAWAHFFSDGHQSNVTKGTGVTLRPIRAF